VTDLLRYDGKRTIVTGAASGMGAEVARLVLERGGEVYALDINEPTVEVSKYLRTDLSDPGSIEAAVESIGGPVHALFSCAGVADGTPGIERINFIGHRYLIDKLLAGNMLSDGSAIGMISSAAGMGWENSLPELHEYLDITDFDAATAWAQEHNHADYMWSKKTINAYVAREASPLLKQGIRINAIMPGPTDTPLAQANKEMWLGFGSDYRAELGIDASAPIEQAYPLVFLCSDAARGITGITIITDAGYFAAGVAGTFQPAQEAVGFLRSI